MSEILVSHHAITYSEMFDQNRQILMAKRTKMTIDEKLVIKAGEEKTIKDKNVVIHKEIVVNGKLIFENCEIDTTPMGRNYGKVNEKDREIYGGFGEIETIFIQNGTLVMLGCEFIKKPVPNESYEDALVYGFSYARGYTNYGSAIKAEGKYEIYIENCYFDKIHKYLRSDGSSWDITSDSLIFKHCLFENNYDTFITNVGNLRFEQCTIKNQVSNFFGDISYPTLLQCVFTNEKNTGDAIFTGSSCSYGEQGIIEHCSFTNCGGIRGFTGSIRSCTFDNVWHYDGGKCTISFDEYRFVRDKCQVIDCSFLNSPEVCIAYAGKIADCLFTTTSEFSTEVSFSSTEKKGYIMAQLNDRQLHVNNCTFRNLKFNSKESFYLIGHQDFYRDIYKMSLISNCIFENCIITSEAPNLIAEHSIGSEFLFENLATKIQDFFFDRHIQVAEIQNCKFINSFAYSNVIPGTSEDDWTQESYSFNDIKDILKNNPSLLSEAANFVNIAAQYRLITSQDLNTTAQAVNKVLNTNLTFEGTKQFARDIQVFQRMNAEAFSKSGVFSSAESVKDYLANATEGQAETLKRKLTGAAQEVDWLNFKRDQLSNLWEKSTLLNKNAPGIDGETINRFTGKTVNSTTIKATVSDDYVGNRVQEVAEAIKKGTATEQDVIVGVKGTKEAVEKIGLKNPVTELNTADTIKESTERIAKKIEQGQAATSVTIQDAAKRMCNGAVIGAAVGLTISSVVNYIKYKNGNITKEEAFRDIGEDTVKGTLIGGTMAGVTIFLPGGPIGFVAGMAIGIYFNATFTNILDEIFGKGAFLAIMESSDYVAGTAKNLADCVAQIEADERRIAQTTKSINAKKQEINENINKVNNLLEGF